MIKRVLAWVLGIALLGMVMGAITAKRKHERYAVVGRTHTAAPRQEENAAAGYIEAVESVWQPGQFRRDVDPRGEMRVSNAYAVQERAPAAVKAMQQAADRPQFDPDSVRYLGQPVGSGRILDDMDRGSLLLSYGAMGALETGDWKQALLDIKRLSKLGAQAWSTKSGSRVSASIEQLAVRCWWKFVRRKQNDPEAMAEADRWVDDYMRSMPIRLSSQQARDQSKPKWLAGAPEPKGVFKRKAPDPVAAYHRQHSVLECARLAMDILKSKSYKTAQNGVFPGIKIPIDPSTGRPFEAGGGGDMFYLATPGPGTGVRLQIYEYDVNPKQQLYGW